MRGIFVGTVELSWHCLRTLLDMGEEIELVVTFPSERAASVSAFKSFDDLGVRYSVPIHTTVNVNSDETVSLMASSKPEVLYVIGWPQIVKLPILQLPSVAAIGLHSSLLPKYRGGAPVNWGLIHGEERWGVTLMHLGEGVDTGDVIASAEFDIDPEDTCATVYDKCAEASVGLIQSYVPRLADGTAPRIPQDDAKATTFRQRKPEDGLIDWSRSAEDLSNWVRALTHPYPGAFTHLPDGRKLFVWKAFIANDERVRKLDGLTPGTIIGPMPYEGVHVQTGEGVLVVVRVEVESGMEMPASVWLAHEPEWVGAQLG